MGEIQLNIQKLTACLFCLINQHENPSTFIAGVSHFIYFVLRNKLTITITKVKIKSFK